MTVDIVIPNYNGFNLIEKNLLEVVKAFTGAEINASVIIVDDHSNIANFELLKKFVDLFNQNSKIKVRLLRNQKNYGFSTTVNNGVRESKAEFVVLLNSDAVPRVDFLAPLLSDFKNNDKLFGVGCMDESLESGEIVFRGRGEGSWKKGFLAHRKGDVENSTDTLWISGGSSIVRREHFEAINGFDTIFNPFYWEDIDLSYRAKKCGYKIIFDKRSRVTHIHEEGAIKKNFKKSYIKKIAYRNQFIFVWKDITDQKLLIDHLLWLPYHFLKAVQNKDMEFLLGFILALSKLPDIIAKRKVQKRLFVLRDAQVLSS